MATLDTYSKTTWVNNNTPINASNMNNLEEGVFDNRVQINANEDEISGIDTRLTTAEGEIDTLQSNMTTAQGNITSLQSNLSRITALETKVGSTTLDTTAQTVTGAINEVNTSVNTLNTKVGSTAMTTTAQTVTGAINELNTKRVPAIVTTTLATGTWSNSEYSFEGTYPVASYRLEIELNGDSATQEQISAWSGAMILGSASANKIYAKGTVPEVAIPVILTVWTL